MAPGGEGGGPGDDGGNNNGDAAALGNGGNGGGSTNGNAAAAPVVSSSAAAAVPPQQQRAPGGFKIKVKLPPRQPSGDGASVAGGGMAATDANANAAASLKRPADGPPADVGGAAAPPQKLKITLK